MTPVEKLQAAIEKLERLARHSAPVGSRWEAHDRGAARYLLHETEIRATGLGDGFFDGIALVGDAADAELIVTLHRTIDAQLEILRFAVKRLEAITTLTGLHLQAHEHEMALSDAILGGDE